jgi:hypothetical protein
MPDLGLRLKRREGREPNTEVRLKPDPKPEAGLEPTT